MSEHYRIVAIVDKCDYSRSSFVGKGLAVRFYFVVLIRAFNETCLGNAGGRVALIRIVELSRFFLTRRIHVADYQFVSVVLTVALSESDCVAVIKVIFEHTGEEFDFADAARISIADRDEAVGNPCSACSAGYERLAGTNRLLVFRACNREGVAFSVVGQ